MVGSTWIRPTRKPIVEIDIEDTNVQAENREHASRLFKHMIVIPGRDDEKCASQVWNRNKHQHDALQQGIHEGPPIDPCLLQAR